MEIGTEQFQHNGALFTGLDFIFKFFIREGLKKSIMENSILKLDYFLRTFCKKCIFTIENPKNDKTTYRHAHFCLLRCQIFHNGFFLNPSLIWKFTQNISAILKSEM